MILWSIAKKTENLPVYANRDYLVKIINYILIDYPEIFWLEEDGVIYTNTLNGEITDHEYEFSYSITKEERISLQKEIDKVTGDLLQSAEELTSEFDKALFVYDYIIDGCKYDQASAEMIDINISDPKLIKSTNIDGVLLDKDAICEGYAKTAQFLLNKLGIFATYITGGTHAWNLIQLNGNYYYMDTTWGDPEITDMPSNMTNKNYDNFAMTTEELLKTHSPAENIAVPNCTSREMNYFQYKNLTISKYSKNAVKKVIKTFYDAGSTTAFIHFSDKEIYNQSIQNLLENGDITYIMGQINKRYLDNKNVTYIKNQDYNSLMISLVFE